MGVDVILGLTFIRWSSGIGSCGLYSHAAGSPICLLDCQQCLAGARPLQPQQGLAGDATTVLCSASSCIITQSQNMILPLLIDIS